MKNCLDILMWLLVLSGSAQLAAAAELSDNEAVEAGREAFNGRIDFPWYERETDDIRRSDELLADLPFLLDIQTYGDQLNLIVSGPLEAAKTSVRDRLAAQNITIRRLETTAIRMEEAFIYLVRTAREEVGA